jgi:hypothetical protein
MHCEKRRKKARPKIKFLDLSEKSHFEAIIPVFVMK